MTASDLFLHHQNSQSYYLCLSYPFLLVINSFWMQEDFVKVWNIAGVSKKKGDNPHFLTNNALEMYNCHFNSIVPSAHPNLVVFAHALREEA